METPGETRPKSRAKMCDTNCFTHCCPFICLSPSAKRSCTFTTLTKSSCEPVQPCNHSTSSQIPSDFHRSRLQRHPELYSTTSKLLFGWWRSHTRSTFSPNSSRRPISPSLLSHGRTLSRRLRTCHSFISNFQTSVRVARLGNSGSFGADEGE